MNSSLSGRGALVGLVIGLGYLAGCSQPSGDRGDAGQSVKHDGGQRDTPQVPARVASAAAESVDEAKELLDQLGSNASYKLLPGGVLTEIVIRDGSALSGQNIVLFGKLTDLESLQIHNFRDLNDEMAAHLAGLKNLKSLAMTNSLIGDPTVELIASSFPKLTDLDVSSNTMLTNSALKVVGEMSQLERLSIVQNGVNDLGTFHLSKLQNLRVLDLRGNMEVGDMTMEIVGALPKLQAFKHRSTTVSDFGMEYLAESKTLESLLMQDFAVTGQAGLQIAKLGKLTQLEIFRCEGFGSDGVLALAGMPLTRLTLRGLPSVDDQAMVVFADLPRLQRLYLHELPSIGDSGLTNLSALDSLVLLDVWDVPQMSDATVDVIATLPNIKQLSIRSTGITDAAIDKLLAMPNLEALTLKDNGLVTAEGLKKLSSEASFKLDIDPAGDGQ